MNEPTNQTTHNSNKAKATKIAMSVAFILAISKVTIGFITGSLSILSSAVDSILDIASSFFNFIAIKKAEEPADQDHEYGHGKYEAMATLIQSMIIFMSGIMILIAAWNKFINNTHPEVTTAGLTVMGISIIATIMLTIYLRYMAKKENSSVLEADAMHYSIDLYTNAGILFALILIKFTGLYIIDSIVAAIVAIYIIISAIKLGLQVSNNLLDSKIEEEAYSKLVTILNSFEDCHKDFHKLRTRSSGNDVFIDMHLTLCGKLTLAEVHDITDMIELAIQKAIPKADITIHPEPCNSKDQHHDCHVDSLKEGIKKLASRYGIQLIDNHQHTTNI